MIYIVWLGMECILESLGLCIFSFLSLVSYDVWSGILTVPQSMAGDQLSWLCNSRSETNKVPWTLKPRRHWSQHTGQRSRAYHTLVLGPRTAAVTSDV